MNILTGLISIILIIGLIGFSIYTVVLYVKLLRRGIKALNIYINKNKEVTRGEELKWN